MGEDNNTFADFSGWNLSNSREQEMALKRREEEEKAQEEAQSKLTENGGNASQGINLNSNGTVAQLQDPTQNIVQAPKIPAPTTIPQQTNMAVSQQANGGLTWKDLVSQGFDVEASTSPEEVTDPNFNKEYRGSRAAEVKNLETQSKVTENGGNASTGVKLDANGKVLPMQYEYKPQPTPTPEPVDETTEEINDMPQNWDQFRVWYNDQLEREKKARSKNAWWELLTKGLVGSANIYGTTQGAPALDLSGSKDAFDDKDAYARLDKEKTNMFNLVNKQIEANQKAQAYELQVAKLEATLERQKRQDEELHNKTLAQIAHIKNEDEAAKAKIEEENRWHNVQEGWKAKELEIREATAKAQQYHYYNGSSTSGKKSGTKSKGQSLVGRDGKKRYYGTSPDWVGMAIAAGANEWDINGKADKAKSWIQKNCNNPKLKQFEVQ